MSKYIALTFIFCLTSLVAYTQSPNASAILDVESTEEGVLLPRMTQAEKEVIAHPVEGLTIYQIDGLTGYYVYQGESWNHLGPTNYADGLNIVPLDTNNAHNMGSSTIQYIYASSGLLYDTGGPNGNYGNSENKTVNVFTNMTAVIVTVEMCDLESPYDSLTIFGQVFTGSQTGSVFVPDGDFNIIFKTNAVNTAPGFKISWRGAYLSDSIQVDRQYISGWQYEPTKTAVFGGMGSYVTFHPDSIGKYSVNFGYRNKSKGDGANTFGWQNNNGGGWNLVTGVSNTATGYAGVMAGTNNTDNGDDNIIGGFTNSILAGRGNCVSGDHTKIDGYSNIVSGNHIGLNGSRNIVSGLSIYTQQSIYNNIISGSYHPVITGSGNIINGYENTNQGNNNILIGSNNTILKSNSLCIGDGNTLNTDNSLVLGQYAVSQQNALFVIGTGANQNNRNNGLMFSTDGKLIMGVASGQEMNLLNSNVFDHSGGSQTLGSGGRFGILASKEATNETGGMYFDGNAITLWAPGDGQSSAGVGAAFLLIADEDRWSDNNGNPYDNSALIAYMNGSGLWQQSDENRKEAIRPLTNSLDKISQLNAYAYRFKTNDEEKAKKQVERQTLGLLAQEVHQVIPEAVTLSDHGEYFVNYSQLVPVLLEAIKELKAEVEELKNQ